MRRNVVEESSVDWAVFVGGVALRNPAGFFLVLPQLHSSVLKPSLNLPNKKKDSELISTRTGNSALLSL